MMGDSRRDDKWIWWHEGELRWRVLSKRTSQSRRCHEVAHDGVRCVTLPHKLIRHMTASDDVVDVELMCEQIIIGAATLSFRTGNVLMRRQVDRRFILQLWNKAIKLMMTVMTMMTFWCEKNNASEMHLFCHNYLLFCFIFWSLISARISGCRWGWGICESTRFWYYLKLKLLEFSFNCTSFSQFFRVQLNGYLQLSETDSARVWILGFKSVSQIGINATLQRWL